MEKVFPIVPVSNKPVYIMLGFDLLMVAILIFTLYMTFSIKTARFKLSSAGIEVKGDMYSRSVPMSKLEREKARIIKLEKGSQLYPKWKTNGIALPGYLSGWFKLNNGHKALLFVSDKTQVVYVPTRDGYDLMVSPVDAEKFLKELKEI